MPIDPAWLQTLVHRPDLDDRDTFDVDGVTVELPIPNGRGHSRFRDWQRRILPDILPDSVNADAPERTPFRILHALTTSTGTAAGIEDVLSEELAPLEPVFRGETIVRRKMTLAFHVLAVKAAPKSENDAKGFTERTFVLLCRRPDGTLEQDLVRAVIDRFRLPPSELDLAQRTVLERIQPGWTPDDEPTFDPDAAGPDIVPYDVETAKLFQQDLRTLVSTDLPAADFFRELNVLLSLHMGLYQPRMAARLNPQMKLLFEAMAQPLDADLLPLVRRMEALVDDAERRHPFHGALACRAPDVGTLRPVTLHTPARNSFVKLAEDLASFHFHVLVLVQLRRLVEAWLAHQWELRSDYLARKLAPAVQDQMRASLGSPAQILARMDESPEFRRYLYRALHVLSVRFARNQLAENDWPAALEEIGHAASPMHALKRLYERHSTNNSRNATSSRAWRQGISMTTSLLRVGHHGLVQGRQRVGPFFELGAGLLPLLILLAVGPNREKVPIEAFWRRLADYGLSFDAVERELVLGRLRAMGVYERFSDAGEAAYVRNLMVTKGAA